jgi:hypothetical protein
MILFCLRNVGTAEKEQYRKLRESNGCAEYNIQQETEKKNLFVDNGAGCVIKAAV